MTSAPESRGSGIVAAKGGAVPLVRPPEGSPAESASPPHDRSATTGGAKVLVLATDRLNARVYHDLLEAGGYDPAVPKAIDRWREALREWQPDLVLIDPGASGGAGMAAARAIMRGPDVRLLPMIVVTDASDPGEAERLVGGCAGRIVKPISLPAFFEPIEAALAHSSRRAAGEWARSA